MEAPGVTLRRKESPMKRYGVVGCILVSACGSGGGTNQFRNDLGRQDGPASLDGPAPLDLTAPVPDDLAMVSRPDLTVPGVLYRLPEGVYRVTAPVANLVDGCLVDPNNANNPTSGSVWAVRNDGMGNIKLGNPTNP